MKIKIEDIANNQLSPSQAEALQKYFQEGGTWKDLLEFSEDEAEGIYATAYDYYEKQEWDKSLATFSTLIQLNPYEAKYWMGIGAILQIKEDLEEAIAAYEMALTFDENHVRAHFALAQCYYHQEKKEKCKEHLESVIKICDASGQDSELSQKASQVLKAVAQVGEMS